LDHLGHVHIFAPQQQTCGWSSMKDPAKSPILCPHQMVSADSGSMFQKNMVFFSGPNNDPKMDPKMTKNRRFEF